jgi:hypothetical protein
MLVLYIYKPVVVDMCPLLYIYKSVVVDTCLVLYIYKSVVVGTCPVLCSNNGEYVEGACRCFPGWKGAECSIRCLHYFYYCL